jgi:hypothetical protein
MNAYLFLLTELAASVALSLAVLLMLSRPLMNVLRLLCPGEQAARFWLSYTRVMLTITPLLFTLIFSLFAHFSDPLDNARLAAIAALGGLLMGLWTIGKRLGRFAANFGQKQPSQGEKS